MLRQRTLKICEHPPASLNNAAREARVRQAVTAGQQDFVTTEIKGKTAGVLTILHLEMYSQQSLPHLIHAI